MPNDNLKITIEDIYALIKQVNENLSGKIGNLETEIKTVSVRLVDGIASLNNSIQVLEADNSQLKNRLHIAERKLRSNNLVFYGIKGENRDLEQIQDTIQKKLGITLHSFDITNIHRIGKKEQNIRPILVTFLSQIKRREILHKRTNLKGTGIFISEDLTEKDQKERNSLLKYLKQAKKSGKEVYIRNSKLVINGVAFTAEELEENPPEHNLPASGAGSVVGNLEDRFMRSNLGNKPVNLQEHKNKPPGNHQLGIDDHDRIIKSSEYQANSTGAISKVGPSTRSANSKRK